MVSNIRNHWIYKCHNYYYLHYFAKNNVIYIIFLDDNSQNIPSDKNDTTQNSARQQCGTSDELEGGYENENELELHDYVNLQECQEMMNSMQQSLFAPHGSEPNFQKLDNLSHNDNPAIYQNELYCNNCNKKLVYSAFQYWSITINVYMSKKSK